MAGARHGQHIREHYYIEGEGFCGNDLKLGSLPSGRRETLKRSAYAPKPEPEPEPDPDRAFRFCRMFDLPRFEPEDASLVALGQAMLESGNDAAGDTSIPAGFTYFGQFVDHDITFDRTDGLPTEGLDPDEIVNSRSPSLDLDSLYGRGRVESHELYDGDRFLIGMTTGRSNFGVTESLPFDLPRQGPSGENPKQAHIGDPRNDENLAVAQTHLAMLRFHNQVGQQEGDFEKARAIVTQHYQSVVLHDFLPRITQQAVVDDVLTHGRHFYAPKGFDGPPCMPIEFSVAAYRFGHSMIRSQYEWNRVFRTGGVTPATLRLLFDFTGGSGLGADAGLGDVPTLPTDWIVDWRRLHDFSNVSGISNHAESNATRRIDTNLALGLSDLPEFSDQMVPHLKSLAVRNLLRGRVTGLPTGQDVATAVGADVLTPQQLTATPHGPVLEAGGFHETTPLWYYILRESQVQEQGLRLGQVGSRIVVEVFHGLIEASPHSILGETAWTPSLPAVGDHYTFAELLAFAGDVNPIGD